MKLGIMLPVYRAYSQGEFEKIDAILAAGFSTLWLREWPSGIGVPGQRDHGSGHDPLIHAVQLAPRLTRTPEAIGFAALRLDYRLPMITARALVTCQYFSGVPLLAGLGAGTSSESSVESASKDWAAIRSFLNTSPEEDTFILPPNFQPPKMYMASNNPELWKRIEYNAEGWLTYRIDPRRLMQLATQIREYTPDVEIAIALWWNLDVGDKDALQWVENNALKVGERRLRQFVREWKRIGVTHLIYQPPRTPSDEQLRAMVDAVMES